MNPKRDTAEGSSFCASLKREYRIIGLNVVKRLPAISKELGIDVFTTERGDEQRVAKRLLASPVKALLARIEFSPVRLFFINDRQINFISELITPERCVQQVQSLRDLLLKVRAKDNGQTS